MTQSTDPIGDELRRLATKYGVSDSPHESLSLLLGRIAAIEAVLLELPEVTPSLIGGAKKRLRDTFHLKHAEATLDHYSYEVGQRR